MLDIDGDNHISFSEFIAPILETIPPRVAICFVSDIRFKMEVFTNLRHAYRTVSQISEVVTIDLIRGKLLDRQDALSQHYAKALDELVFDSECVTEKQFMREVARMEKHCLTSFTNLLFKQMDPTVVDEDDKTREEIQAGIDNEEIEKDALKLLLKKSLSLHKADLDLYIPPRDKNTWMRFRNCTSAFYEVITNPVVSLKSQAEIFVQNQEMKSYIAELEKEIRDNKDYKELFEALEKSQAPEYEKILAQTKKQLAMSRQDAINLRTDIAKQKMSIDLYQQFADNKFNKDALEDQLAMIKAKASAFDVKLKKIKIKTVERKHAEPESPSGSVSIKDLQARYNKDAIASTDVKIDRVVEVVEEDDEAL